MGLKHIVSSRRTLGAANSEQFSFDPGNRMSTWYGIWLMERVGLAWDFKRPRFSDRREILRERTAA
jgi:hypothetical protein